MTYDDFTSAIDEAKHTVSQGDRVLGELLPLLPGRLRHAHRRKGWPATVALRAIKRELRDFNSTTGTWKG